MIAHQGGWDEILLVLGPIAVIVGSADAGAQASRRCRAEVRVRKGGQPPTKKPAKR